MPAVEWPLTHGRPTVELRLSLATGGYELIRNLVADTGAGTKYDVFELILDEDDCLQCGGIPIHHVQLRGAFVGLFPVYLLDIRIPALHFDYSVPVCGVPQTPKRFDGIACFKFLRRFSFGNFGQPDSFGLDALMTP